jgi:hypothetical protein
VFGVAAVVVALDQKVVLVDSEAELAVVVALEITINLLQPNFRKALL